MTTTNVNFWSREIFKLKIYFSFIWNLRSIRTSGPRVDLDGFLEPYKSGPNIVLTTEAGDKGK